MWLAPANHWNICSDEVLSYRNTCSDEVLSYTVIFVPKLKIVADCVKLRVNSLCSSFGTKSSWHFSQPCCNGFLLLALLTSAVAHHYFFVTILFYKFVVNLVRAEYFCIRIHSGGAHEHNRTALNFLQLLWSHWTRLKLFWVHTEVRGEHTDDKLKLFYLLGFSGSV